MSIFIFCGGELLVQKEKDGLVIPAFDSTSTLPFDAEAVEPFSDNNYAVLINTEALSSENQEKYELRSLREFYKETTPEFFAEAATALHLTQWRKNTKFCSHDGTPLERHKSERAMSCPSCRRLFFPRISPCIIVAIIKDDTLLLAHNKNFKSGAYSVLAGFMEAGETPEQTAHREVLEEVGIEIENLRYVESQAWPFPDSLMIGFMADWKSGELNPDGVEIEEAQWFKKDELPIVPSKMAIGGKLVHRAFEEIEDKQNK